MPNTAWKASPAFLAHAELVGKVARVTRVPAALLDRGADLLGAEAELLRERGGKRLRPADAGPAGRSGRTFSNACSTLAASMPRASASRWARRLAVGGDVLERGAEIGLVDPEAVREIVEAWSQAGGRPAVSEAGAERASSRAVLAASAEPSSACAPSA